MGNPLPADVKTPNEALQKIRVAQEEYLYVFGKGRPKKFQGTYNQVHVDPKWALDFENAKICHNHPNGTSFSIEDIIGLIKFNVKECHLATANYTYFVYRPGSKWGIDIENKMFENQINICLEYAETTLDRLVVQREITLYEKEVEKFHYLWLFFFTQLNNVKYGRKKVT